MPEASDSSMRLLHPARIAARFDVSVRTVERWMAKHAVTVAKTPGGHRRIVDDDQVRPPGDKRTQS